MQFYDFQTSYSIINKTLSKKERNKLGYANEEEFLSYYLQEAQRRQDPLAYRQCAFEVGHYGEKRPYYNVYPAVLPILNRIRLELAGDLIQPPSGLNHLLLKLPKQNNPFTFDGHSVRTIFMSFQEVRRDVGSEVMGNGLVVGLDTGEKEFISGLEVPIYTMKIFPLDERPVEETIDSLKKHPSSMDGIDVPAEIIKESVKLAISVCLIGNDPTILQPKPLSKDLNQFKNGNDTVRRTLIEKAHRRGVKAFDLGKDIESTPHLRNGHMALFWTREGRKTPIIKYRKGSMVHRHKLTEVPTGYEEE